MTGNRLNLTLHSRCKGGGQSQETDLQGAAIGQHHADIHMEGTALREGNHYKPISLEWCVPFRALCFEHVRRWEVKEGKATRVGYDV